MISETKHTKKNRTQKEFLSEMLYKGACEMGVPLSDVQKDQLLNYLLLLEKWNQSYNLSAVRHIDDMVVRHLLDALSVVEYLADSGERFLDVGSGGGIPGIPLAILFPEKDWTLLDSNGKKTRFLFQVKLNLSLTNVHIEHRRVESFVPTAPYDGIISRAFASLADMTVGCAHLLKPSGYLWAMKGCLPAEEINDLPAGFRASDCHPLTVPGCNEQRHLVVIAMEHPKR